MGKFALFLKKVTYDEKKNEANITVDVVEIEAVQIGIQPVGRRNIMSELTFTVRCGALGGDVFVDLWLRKRAQLNRDEARLDQEGAIRQNAWQQISNFLGDHYPQASIAYNDHYTLVVCVDSLEQLGKDISVSLRGLKCTINSMWRAEVVSSLECSHAQFSRYEFFGVVWNADNFEQISSLGSDNSYSPPCCIS